MLGFKNNGVQVQEYVYDFATDGGAIGQIDLSAKSSKDPLDAGSVIKSVHYQVVAAPTSGGAATIAIGDVSAAAVYKAATAFNDASYVLNFVAAAAIGVPNYMGSANEGKFAITIAGAALTAGKIVFFVEFMKASE